MALSNRYSGLERRVLRLTENDSTSNPRKNSFHKLLKKIEGDPTVGSKVMALSNWYYGPERRDLRLAE
jgi:hypothetical protein